MSLEKTASLIQISFPDKILIGVSGVPFFAASSPDQVATAPLMIGLLCVPPMIMLTCLPFRLHYGFLQVLARLLMCAGGSVAYLRYIVPILSVQVFPRVPLEQYTAIAGFALLFHAQNLALKKLLAQRHHQAARF